MFTFADPKWFALCLLRCGRLAVVFSLLGCGSVIASDETGAASLHKDNVGAQLYQTHCASCHGDAAEGVEDSYSSPLAGNLTRSALTRLIDRTMPEGEPETVAGDEAEKVANYLYDEFYSWEARVRKGVAEPPRVELARLTVPQYRNAAADLLARFTPATNRIASRRRRGGQSTHDTPPQPGWRAAYYGSKGMSKADKLVQERIDKRIDFDFGEQSPGENMPDDQFAIIWQGSLATYDTGHYEFRVKTENGVRLYLNVDQTGSRRRLRDDSSSKGQSALIDGWVSSGKMREHKARAFLLAGRKYPIRVEFFKYKDPSASIQVEWKPPQGSWQVLNHLHVSTARSPRLFVVPTPFPADDRSLGYERGSAVSREWHLATNAAAIAIADEVINRLPIFLGRRRQPADESNDKDESIEQRVRRERQQEGKLLLEFAEVAFRRPLSKFEVDIIERLVYAPSTDREQSIRRAVLFVVKSPHFLYADLTPPGETPTQFAVASRLSFALWDSLPDRPLYEAAKRGELVTEEQLVAQANRMLKDPRAKAKVRGFFHDWLELGERDLGKDPQLFPNFDDAVVSELRLSLELFVDSIVWSEKSDYRQLLLADSIPLNQRLAQLYSDSLLQPSQAETAANELGDGTVEAVDSGTCDVDGGEDSTASDRSTDLPASDGEQEGDALQLAAKPDPDDFVAVRFPADRRSGVLTHPYLLSALAYHNNTSPIHRGVFVTRNIVGRSLKAPPVAVAFKDDEFAPDLTMREKITQLTGDAACISCHSVINPLGFAFENYDAIGRFRLEENRKPIDTVSRYVAEDGGTIQVRSARDIAEYAVEHPAATQAFATQLFRYVTKQGSMAYGFDTAERLNREFVADDYNIKKLLVRIAVTSAKHGIISPPSGG